MDKQGNILTGKENEFLRSFSEKGLEKDEEEAPRKVTLSEYLSSPEFQRKRKIERERKDREAFEKKMAFRSAQEQNPIKGKPRRKRGRKARYCLLAVGSQHATLSVFSSQQMTKRYRKSLN